METANKRAAQLGLRLLSLNEVKLFQRAYLESFPSIPKWQNETWETLKKTRKLVNPFGRVREFFGPLDDTHTRKEALAYVPQSTVADLVDEVLVELSKDPEITLAIQAHDAVGGWGPKETVEKWSKRILHIMSRPIPGLNLVVPVELKVGERLSEMKKVC